MNSGPSENGRFYWCIKTALSPDEHIYAYADKVEIMGTGELVLSRVFEDGLELLMLCFAKGSWSACFAASTVDGTPAAVEHWTGEVDRT